MMAEGMDVLLCRGTACIVSQSKTVQVCETEIMLWDK